MQFVKENWIWLLAVLVLVVEGVSFVVKKTKKSSESRGRVDTRTRSLPVDEEDEDFESFDEEEEEKTEQESVRRRRRRRAEESLAEQEEDEQEENEDENEEETEEETEGETEEEEPLISDNFISILMSNKQEEEQEQEEELTTEEEQEPVEEELTTAEEQEPALGGVMNGLHQFRRTIKEIESERLDLNGSNFKCKVNYEVGVKDKVLFTSKDFIFPLNRVFVNGFEQKWNSRFEIVFRKGDVVEIDTCCEMEIPRGTKLQLFVTEETTAKFGVVLSNNSKLELNRFDSKCGVHAVFRAVTDGYLAKYQDILRGTLEPVL